jgi:hypothetical protein
VFNAVHDYRRQVFDNAKPRNFCGESVLKHSRHRSTDHRDTYNSLPIVDRNAKQPAFRLVMVAVVLANERERLSLRYWL